MYKVFRFYEQAYETGTSHRLKWDVVSEVKKYKWTQENVDNCIDKRTLKFFRRAFDSKQVVKYKDNKIILYSYAPNRLDYRYTTIMEGFNYEQQK